MPESAKNQNAIGRVTGMAQDYSAQDHFIDQIYQGASRAIAKAITLVESTRPDHQQQAMDLLKKLLPHTAKALRIGITGVPGVGKSTFIEALGLYLVAHHLRVAVLAVDPSSLRSGGSILGDKTRMEELGRSPLAYIRPTPARGSLGGVAAHTREAMLICAAAGFDVILIETVGVGQSEFAVASISDLFVLLQLPNAGDELQSLKKGIVEAADIVVCNKMDIDPHASSRVVQQWQSALNLLYGGSRKVPVLEMSATLQQGFDSFWDVILQLKEARLSSGAFAARRQHQALDWMWQTIDEALRQHFRDAPAVRANLAATVQAVEQGRLEPLVAALQLLALFKKA